MRSRGPFFLILSSSTPVLTNLNLLQMPWDDGYDVEDPEEKELKAAGTAQLRSRRAHLKQKLVQRNKSLKH